MELAATWDAALPVEDGVAAEPELAEEPAVGEPAEAGEALLLAEAEAAPGVGAPKVATPDAMGPTGAEAEAPTPTKLPTFCPGLPEEDSAAFWKARKVLDPVAGALMAPTIPAIQWGEGLSCLQ